MNYYDAGYAAGQFVIAVAVLAGLSVGIVAIVRASRKPAQPSTTDAYWIAAFALTPGERCGFVWQAAHTAGHPMIATITSTGVFALNHYAPQAPPMRLRPEGCGRHGGLSLHGHTWGRGADGPGEPLTGGPAARLLLDCPERRARARRVGGTHPLTSRSFT